MSFEFEDEEGCFWPSYKDYFIDKYLFGAGAYDSEIADDAINVLKYLGEKHEAFYYTDVAKALNLDPKYVAVFLDLFAHSNLTEYGTSPRGSWLTDKGEEALEQVTIQREIAHDKT